MVTMDNINQPPFHVGQKVVCVKSSEGGLMIKDTVYTVAGQYRCAYCGKWRIGVLEFPLSFCTGSCSDLCKSPIIYTGIYYAACYASYFAPITEQYEDMTSEIAQSVKQTNEVPDKVLIPETINN